MKCRVAFATLVVLSSCAEPKPAANTARSWSTTKTTQTPATTKLERPRATPIAATEAAPPSVPDTQRVDPRVVSRLEKMGSYLRAQRAYVVRTEATTDDILENGQKIQLSSTSEVWVKTPNRLRIKTASDRKVREMYYDGATFTLFGARVGYYAQFKAPPTIGQTIDVAEARYGIEIPVVDIFYWGTDESIVEGLTSAISVGPSRVRGIPTEHFVLRQDDLDWQLWVQLGDRPLPRKLVITTTSEPTQPQHVVMLDWGLGALLPDALFKFRPPPGAYKIEYDMSPPAAAPSTP